jgi:hypothetical protein
MTNIVFFSNPFWLRAKRSGARNQKDTALRQAQHKFQTEKASNKIKILSINNIIRHSRMIDQLTFLVTDLYFRNMHSLSFSDKSCNGCYDSLFFAS